MINCLMCSNITKNPKFCSRKCAGIQNGKLFPKRKPVKKCKTCDTLIAKGRTYCVQCRANRVANKDITLSEAIYTKYHRSSAFALVRSRARTILPHQPCQKCGYTSHTEVCHIKPIAEFDVNAKLSVINALTNLIRLCPNCHWEKDNKKKQTI